MLTKLKQRDSEGFTIIEVLIVLAIAALILVVVLIAVPNLQRSQRNSARKDEASRILTAADNYVANNNGTQLTASNSTEANAIIGDSGKLQQYSSLSGGSSDKLTANELNIASLTSSSSDFTPVIPSSDAILVVQGGTCDPTTPGKVDVGNSTRTIALVYTLEKSGSGYSIACMGG